MRMMTINGTIIIITAITINDNYVDDATNCNNKRITNNDKNGNNNNNDDKAIKLAMGSISVKIIKVVKLSMYKSCKNRYITS